MADDDKTASLEPPSFFGRKKRRGKAESEATPEPATQPEADADIRPEVEPVPPPPEVDEGPTTILDSDQSAPQRPEPPPPLFADEEPVQPAPSVPVEPSVPAEPVEQVGPAEPAAPKPPRQPWITGRAAAAVTGLLVGAVIVAATSAALRLCTWIKGTDSCGNPAFLLWVAILTGAVLLGSVLLRAARVPQPGSTSFLAVALVSVVALLFLVNLLLEWWMVIVIPAVSIACYLVSHYVTTTYIEPEIEAASTNEEPDVHDIR